MNTCELGKIGEIIAEKHLEAKGIFISDRNVRYKKYEVDLIAETDNEVIVIEVKLRHTRKLGEPWRSVTRSKQRQIIMVANNYVKKRNCFKDVRFDIVSIIQNEFETEIEHLENAFFAC